MLSRRVFLQSAVAAATSGIGVGVYSWQVEPHWLEVVRRPLPVANLPESLVGETLAQLSDIHVGPRVSDDYVLRTLGLVRALDPAIVVYTGDFVSYERGMFDHAAKVYADLPRGRLGTVGVLGNHEYGPGWRHPDIADRLAALFTELGVRILQNEATDVAGLQIAGMDDLWGGRYRPRDALASLDRGCAAIVLSHNPDTVDSAGWDGYEGWVLAGHTHGGQCRPPFLPPPILPVVNRRYTAGEFALSRNRRLYINRGIGHLYQVRFNVRPELTLFELRAT